jgi:hypothetical protein
MPTGKPLDGEIKRAVRTLAARGLSVRAICARLAADGFAPSRGAVHNVLAGRPIDLLEAGEIRVDGARCGGCGGKNAIVPCRTCKARTMRAKIGQSLVAAGVAPKRLRRTIEHVAACESLALDLTPAQRNRLNALRRKRRRGDARGTRYA